MGELKLNIYNQETDSYASIPLRPALFDNIVVGSENKWTLSELIKELVEKVEESDDAEIETR